MKIFLEGGKGNGEYIESSIADNLFMLQHYRITVPDGVTRKIEYEMANPFRLRNGAIVFVLAEIEIPAERLEILYPETNIDLYNSIIRDYYWYDKSMEISG